LIMKISWKSNLNLVKIIPNICVILIISAIIIFGKKIGGITFVPPLILGEGTIC
jgi:hypothetical protein